MFSGEVEIYTDGGCSGNGMPGARAYGSYSIRAILDGAEVKRTSQAARDYPEHNTNNAAELQALIDALRTLAPGGYAVRVYTDSQVLAGWIGHGYKCKAAHLLPLVLEARRLWAQFPNATIYRVPREQIVAVLGH